ncbi:hypothetical protein GW756_01465 [bacterium]|nr:hypothetical protein [bacterium]NCQ55023.1 hypothetical protein [Candidatus Parcubacteria bacterium]NCS67067.1 hypothetical protein [Candidatus Peregrinibacteria bacterium]NCS96013.1 hypothetical protein [bacterium]
MKYLIAFSFLFSVAFAQSLPQQYAELSAEQKQKYETVAYKLKPTLKPLEESIRTIANNDRMTRSARLQSLNTMEARLENWVGASVLKYTIMLPIRSTLKAQMVNLAEKMPLRVPYNANQIKAQFNISGAQPYAYGTDNLALIRGNTEKGQFAKGDRVIVYFKQGGPVITEIQEIVSAPGDREEAFLLADIIEIERFTGGAALFIPQS